MWKCYQLVELVYYINALGKRSGEIGKGEGIKIGDLGSELEELVQNEKGVDHFRGGNNERR